jgi:hypothetical protein
MAGDWIKMRSNLRRHPKVVRLASASNADRLRVVGGLHAVWCLFDEHSEDGCLYGYTPSAVDEEIGWPGFCDLLIAIGWVETDGRDGLSLPDFDTHNGASAKRRAQEADRKRAERAAAADHPHAVDDSSASDADTKRTRGEKKRTTSTSLRSVEGRAARKCPESFEVTAELQTWARQEAPGVDLRRETDKFRDYTFKTAYSDWPGAWRNWMRKASEFRAPGGRPAPQGKYTAAAAGIFGNTQPQQAEVIDV